MRSLVATVYAAGIVLGGVCPMHVMTVAAKEVSPPQLVFEASMIMSPVIPMTPAPMMSLAVHRSENTNLSAQGTTCLGGNCFMANRTGRQNGLFQVSSTEVKASATLRVIHPPFVALLHSLFFRLRGSDYHFLAQHITTIVLRV